MAKLSKNPLSLTAAGIANRLLEFTERTENKELAKLIGNAIQACDRTQTAYADILAGVEKARADRRRTEFGREHFGAELAYRNQKLALADLQTFVEWLSETGKKQEKQVKDFFVEVTDNERSHNTELRRLVREKCKTPAQVNMFVANADAAIGRAVLSAHLMLSGSDEGERGKLEDMFLAAHQPALHSERLAVKQAADMVNQMGTALIGKVSDAVDLSILNVAESA